MRIQVTTFNIRHCRGLDGVVDPERTAAAIRASDSALIALQEVDRAVPRSGRVDQPSALAELTGMSARFFPTLKVEGGEYGLAVLARDEIDATYTVLPRVGVEEPRGAIVVRLDEIKVVASHLSRSRAARVRQLRALAVLAASEPGPVAVVGDLNEGPRGLRPLWAAGLAPGPPRRTRPGPWPRRQIDHVLAGGGAVVADTWTIPSDASDHLPLVAGLELP